MPGTGSQVSTRQNTILPYQERYDRIRQMRHSEVVLLVEEALRHHEKVHISCKNKEELEEAREFLRQWDVHSSAGLEDSFGNSLQCPKDSFRVRWSDLRSPDKIQ